MNYMESIASLLNIELEENFRISNQTKNDADTFFISRDGFFIKDKSGNIDYARASILLDILTGKLEIIPSQFLPKYNEDYYKVIFTQDESGFIKSRHIVKEKWKGNSSDYANYQTGNTFRTEEQALKNIHKVIDNLTKPAPVGQNINTNQESKNMQDKEMKTKLESAIDNLNSLYISLVEFQADESELTSMSEVIESLHDIKESIKKN